MIKYQLYNGDCLKLMKDIPDKSVDMVLCDLPYGVTAKNKWDVVIPFKPLWEQYNRIIKDSGAIVLFGSGLFSADLMISNKKMWRYNLIWEKTQPTGFLNANKMPLRNHEDILVFYKQLPTYNPQKTQGHKRKVSSAKHKEHCRKTDNYGEHNLVSYDSTERFPCSVIEFAKDIQKSALHPTQKPVALLEYLIKTYTNEGETILDNCMGSGSTGVACVNTNRDFIGIELDNHYYEIACDRINKANYIKWGGDKAMKNGTISLLIILQIIFLILKLCGVVTWSWWVVLVPLYLEILWNIGWIIAVAVIRRWLFK